MDNHQHIIFEKLVNLTTSAVGSEMDEGERAQSMQHVGSCTLCAKQLEQLEHVVGLMRTDRELDAPRDVIAYAVNSFARKRNAKAPSLSSRLVAALTFDSRLNLTPAFGMRSGGPVFHQLLYSAEMLDLDLRIAQNENDWIVSGQLLGEIGADGNSASLNLINLDDEHEAAATTANELCEFSLPPVPPGNYQLLVQLAKVEIEIPRLEIG